VLVSTHASEASELCEDHLREQILAPSYIRARARTSHGEKGDALSIT
jgi:hypothetical protein